MMAIALSPNRRYIAIAERGEKPTVTICDLVNDQSKKRKVCKDKDFCNLNNMIASNQLLMISFKPNIVKLTRLSLACANCEDW